MTTQPPDLPEPSGRSGAMAPTSPPVVPPVDPRPGWWARPWCLRSPDQRAEYQGAAHIGHTAGSVWAPALFTWLAMEHGTTGWLVIAVIVLVATATMRTTSRSAEQYLERTTMATGGPR